jgi:hypothetical protein
MAQQSVYVIRGLAPRPVKGLTGVVLVIAGLGDLGHGEQSIGEIVKDTRRNGLSFALL